MISKLLIWLHKERISFDARCIAVLQASLGRQRTREIVEEVTFHLTDRMELLRRALEADEQAEARALTHRMAAMAEQVGFVGFTRVARDLGRCIDRHDPVATAAVAARLERVADGSIVRLIDHADRSAL